MSERAPELPATFSRELRFLVSKMLEKDVERRPDIVQILNYSPLRQRVGASVPTAAEPGR